MFHNGFTNESAIVDFFYFCLCDHLPRSKFLLMIEYYLDVGFYLLEHYPEVSFCSVLTRSKFLLLTE